MARRGRAAVEGYYEDAVMSVKDSLKAAKHGIWPWRLAGDALPVKWQVRAVSRDGLISFVPGELLPDGKWYVYVNDTALNGPALLLDEYELPETGVAFDLVYNRTANTFHWKRGVPDAVGEEPPTGATMATWEDVRAAYWDRDWWELQDDAIADWADDVEARPHNFTVYAESMIKDLRASDANLKRIDEIIAANPSVIDDDDRATITVLTTRYRVLAAGIYAVEPEIGIVLEAGAGVVVLGVVLGVVALAWAVVAYPLAANEREQTALQVAELEARDKASREGRQLPGSTLPPDPNQAVPWGVAALLTAGVGVGGLLWWTRKV